MALKHFKSEQKLQFLQVNLRVLCSKPICNNFQLGKKKAREKPPNDTKSRVQKYYYILPEEAIM